jgi:hypothetical protein
MRTLSTALRVLAALGLAASIVLVAGGRLWIGALGDISTFSVGSVCFLYLLMETRLEKDSVGVGQSIVLAVLYANVFAQTYEVLYHFTFPVYLDYFKPPYLDGADLRYLALEGVMLAPVVLVKKQIRLGVASLALALAFAVVWAVWIMYGYPQYFTTDLFYQQTLAAKGNLRDLSLILNFGSKVILALFFGSLIRPQKTKP